MKMTMQSISLLRAASAILALAISGGATALAGIKYWDNPDYRAFDVDCYVQSDLIWNYDGIRNVGATAAHDPDALTWANLGSFGSANDIVLQRNNSGWTAVSAGELSAGTYGEWTDKGFVFKGNSRFRRNSPGKIQVGTSYTIQFLVDATSAAQVHSYGFLLAVQYEQFALAVSKNANKFFWRTKMAYNSSADYSFMDGGTFDYGTAIVDGTANTTTFFSGIKAPTSGDGFRQYASVEGRDEAGYAIGCTSGAGNEFVGTMKFLRVYDHALSEEEVAWNRVVDERRYFPTHDVSIPITNVVVATAVAGAEGAEPSGTYAVDGRHAFTAPATVTVGGIAYVCTGYTVETRSGGGWSAPVFHKAALYQPVAFVATDSDCVRLTWQWAKADGLANLYTVKDYVWNGLDTFYDGICNDGTNRPHSFTATTWVNLGSTGAVNNVFIQRLNTASNSWANATSLDPVNGLLDPGYWTENGFVLDAKSRFRCNGPGGFAVGTSYSLQMLIDAKASDQTTSYAYPFCLNADDFAFRFTKGIEKLEWIVGGKTYLKPYLAGDTYDYLTAIMKDDGDNDTQTFFSGTTIPTSGSGYTTGPAVAKTETGFCLAGFGSGDVKYRFVGTLKNFRQYNRALTQAEVTQNRKVDDWRYFGIPDVTNVIVQSTVPYLRGDEPDGAYAVDGSHVFTAPSTVTAKGIEYECDGYTVETWGPLGDKGDGWSAATHYTGNTYAYTTSAGKVRLTWKWKATHGLRTAADYSYDDYSQAGIVWHFDGIYNQGVGVARSTTATTWKNLAPNPVTGRIFIQRLNGNANGYANNDSTILGSLIAADGNWTENDKGFTMKGASRWRGLGQVGPVANWTIQSLVDADVNDIANDIEYVVSASWSNFATVLRKNGNGPVPNSFYFNAQDAQNVNTRPYFQDASGKYDFATAILDSSDRTAKMFHGVTPPTGGGIVDGYYQYASITPYKDTNFGIGAPAGSYDQFFIGTLKSIRYYDRVLTEEELTRNRNADAARYFGELGVTNVVVEVEHGLDFVADPVPGAYFVEGSYDFSVSSGNDKPVGYKIQVPNGDGWKTVARHDVTQLHFDAATAPAAKIKIVWVKTNPFLFVVR